MRVVFECFKQNCAFFNVVAFSPLAEQLNIAARLYANAIFRTLTFRLALCWLLTRTTQQRRALYQAAPPQSRRRDAQRKRCETLQARSRTRDVIGAPSVRGSPGQTTKKQSRRRKKKTAKFTSHQHRQNKANYL